MTGTHSRHTVGIDAKGMRYFIHFVLTVGFLLSASSAGSSMTILSIEPNRTLSDTTSILFFDGVNLQSGIRVKFVPVDRSSCGQNDTDLTIEGGGGQTLAISSSGKPFVVFRFQTQKPQTIAKLCIQFCNLTNGFSNCTLERYPYVEPNIRIMLDIRSSPVIQQARNNSIKLRDEEVLLHVNGNGFKPLFSKTGEDAIISLSAESGTILGAQVLSISNNQILLRFQPNESMVGPIYAQVNVAGVLSSQIQVGDILPRPQIVENTVTEISAERPSLILLGNGFKDSESHENISLAFQSSSEINLVPRARPDLSWRELHLVNDTMMTFKIIGLGESEKGILYIQITIDGVRTNLTAVAQLTGKCFVYE